MKSFKQFVTESLNTVQFPLITRALSQRSEKTAERFPRLLDQINSFATGDVPNPYFQAIKGNANQLIEHATDMDVWPMGLADRCRAARWPFDYHEYQSVSYTNQVAGKLKKAEAAAKKTSEPLEIELLAWFVPIMRELNVIANAVENMKPRVVKRQTKPVEDQHQKYVAPMASQASGKLVIDALTEMTRQIYNDYAAAVTAFLMDGAQALDGKTYDEQFKSKHAVLQIRAIWKSSTGGGRHAPVSLVNGYATILKAEGRVAADRMQREFVIKNARKLASIMDAKQSPLKAAPMILKAKAGQQGMFEGDMRLTFMDGSSFEVRNQVVFKTSYHGTYFTQYPTTFHNVILPDGSRMSTPSEERMNDVWVKA